MSAHAEKSRAQTAIALTSYLLHKHYCENDSEAIIALFDDRLSWLGAGEQEYALGTQTVSDIFRTFAGQVPRCNISDEHYDALQIAPDVYLCTGRLWIATDPSTQVYLRVHQRISALFRWTQAGPRCCHIHISNPYSEMSSEDVGFPTGMARQSYEYLQEQLACQTRKIEEQTAQLARLSYEDSLTGLFNRNRFNEELARDGEHTGLGVIYLDLNGLKAVNDRLGHSAGDQLIRRAANHIRRAFPGRGYRIGGDEFVIIDRSMAEAEFRSAAARLYSQMEEDQISVAMGLSWRGGACSVKQQFDEADRLMYQAKASHYRRRENDRRSRR